MTTPTALTARTAHAASSGTPRLTELTAAIRKLHPAVV
ncbi:hypothetical protein P3T35_002218 [Kitasatospora sp. GP30]|nr:hypothetical protein [Kitasatospora sp. GP30]